MGLTPQEWEWERCCLWSLPMPQLCPTEPGMLPGFDALGFVLGKVCSAFCPHSLFGLVGSQPG